MKKKSVLAVLLASAMALSMTACGGSSSAAESKAEPSAPAETEASASAAASEAPEASAAEASEAAPAEDAVPDNEVTGDPSADNAFVIWAWNTDFVTLEDLLVQKYPELKDRLVFVNALVDELRLGLQIEQHLVLTHVRHAVPQVLFQLLRTAAGRLQGSQFR